MGFVMKIGLLSKTGNDLSQVCSMVDANWNVLSVLPLNRNGIKLLLLFKLLTK